MHPEENHIKHLGDIPWKHDSPQRDEDVGSKQKHNGRERLNVCLSNDIGLGRSKGYDVSASRCTVRDWSESLTYKIYLEFLGWWDPELL